MLPYLQLKGRAVHIQLAGELHALARKIALQFVDSLLERSNLFAKDDTPYMLPTINPEKSIIHWRTRSSRPANTFLRRHHDAIATRARDITPIQRGGLLLYNQH